VGRKGLQRNRAHSSLPTSGRLVPEIDRSDIREVILDNYRIVDQLGETSIIILAVFESHRSLDETLSYPTGSPENASDSGPKEFS